MGVESSCIPKIRGRENILRDLYPEYFTDNQPRKRFSQLWIDSLRSEWDYREGQGAAAYALRTYAESAGDIAAIVPDLERILTRERISQKESPAVNFLQIVLDDLIILSSSNRRPPDKGD